MKIYLRIINPAIAVLTFFFCAYAATFDNGYFEFGGIWSGGFHTYFFARGLFTFSSVIMLGEILLKIISKEDPKDRNPRKRSEYLYILGLAIVCLAFIYLPVLTIDLFEKQKEETLIAKKASKKITTIKPEIKDSHLVEEALYIKLVGKLVNNSNDSLEEEDIYTKFYIDNYCIGEISTTVRNIKPNSEKYFEINYRDFLYEKVKGKLTYKLKIQ